MRKFWHQRQPSRFFPSGVRAVLSCFSTCALSTTIFDSSPNWRHFSWRGNLGNTQITGDSQPWHNLKWTEFEGYILTSNNTCGNSSVFNLQSSTATVKTLNLYKYPSHCEIWNRTYFKEGYFFFKSVCNWLRQCRTASKITQSSAKRVMVTWSRDSNPAQ